MAYFTLTILSTPLLYSIPMILSIRIIQLRLMVLIGHLYFGGGDI